MRRLIATLALGLGLVAGQAKAEELNIYSSRHYPSDELLFGKFKEETGITVNLIQGKAAELVERMKLEGANSPADIFITTDAANLWRAQSAGLFQPVTSDKLQAAVPDQFHEPSGLWYAFATRSRVIVYNRDKVKPEQLSTYEALTAPEWKGRVLSRSSNNEYVQSMTAAMIAHLGEAKAEEWAKGIVANFARAPKGGDTDQIKAVAVGEADVALVNHYYYARIAASDKPEDKEIIAKVGIFFPDQESFGTHVNVSGAGVAAHAPNKDAAIKFLEYLASPEAQDIFAEANNEFPVLKGVAPSSVVQSFGDFKRDTLPIDELGKNNAAAVQLLDRAGWR
ncbi:Fe(3+) ABC transporter substrate-binding protein [Zavarzinia aquatilis]|uniref:Fe(3+) ABC transporter substrate-binding protein n=1 Tax=Zavarzinia aquatilis TaxID=2211142 RepID=A0A317EJV2_9PROT|nr:Fe(3+) ABC transporter substrate-binding protein [Zavarzinia aquatilis]PWR25525.1 Fe(3+) ABC transporter substrate-binding protein [Zavarzinia aquatilis]